MPHIGQKTAGDILHLPIVLEIYPDTPLVLYNRVSSYGQASRRKTLLHTKTAAVVKDVEAIAPGRILRTFDGVEEGYLHKPRKKLMEAAEFAAQRNAMLVAVDLSRFLRPLSYSRTENRNARPSPADLARLREMTGGILLATVLPPDLTEDQRHSLAIRRTGKAGRPHVISDERALQLFGVVEYIALSEDGMQKWVPSMRRLAQMFHVSPATMRRLPKMRSTWGPDWWTILTSGEPHNYQMSKRGVIWWAFFPAEALSRARSKE